MFSVIHQSLKFLINFLCLSFISIACVGDDNQKKNPYQTYNKVYIKLSDDQLITTYIAKDHKQQKLGLSHLKKDQFKDNEAMLFMDKKYSMRQFWMPNTYFDLDVFFLNEDFYILDIHRSLEHFAKSGPKDQIPLSKKVYCQHVLEMKSSSPLAKKLQPGMILDIIKNP